MSVDYRAFYEHQDSWQKKVIAMEVFHLFKCQFTKDWTIEKTAKELGLSVGLVSENLRIADRGHLNPKIFDYKTRQEALKHV